MADDKPSNPANQILPTIKDAFTVLREILLLALFVILLFFPKTLNTRLASAGLTKIDGGVFTWEQQKAVEAAVDQSKQAAQANSAATDSVNQAKSLLTSLATQTSDPSLKQKADATIQKLDGSLSSLQTADRSLVRSLVTAQSIQQVAAPASAPSVDTPNQGWVYLGEIDASKQHWRVPPQPKVSADSPVPTVGQTITLTDDVYLRADKGPGQTYSQAAILSAVKSGSTAVITDLQLSSAINGGQFAWAKVTVKGGQ